MNQTPPIIPPPVIDPYRTEYVSTWNSLKLLLYAAIVVGRLTAMIWFLIRAGQANNWDGILYNLIVSFLLFPAWGWHLVGHDRDLK